LDLGEKIGGDQGSHDETGRDKRELDSKGGKLQ
jgi:hypothetical protein